MNEDRQYLYARTVNGDTVSDNWVKPFMPPEQEAWNDWLNATARLLQARNIDHITVTYTDEWAADMNYTGHEYHRNADPPC
jgi:hypothetical protein